MNAPAPTDPHISERVASTLELLAKVAGSLTAVWLFLARVVKPYLDWRRASIGRTIREALKPELEQLSAIMEQEGDCATRMEQILKEQQLLFGDLDMLLDVVLDNSDRIDETNALLDAVGFAAERRTSADRTDDMIENLKRLSERRRARRRGAAT